MIHAKLEVNGVEIKVIHADIFTTGMVGAQVEIDYKDPAWSSLHKTVVFMCGHVTKDVISSESVITIPPEVLKKGRRELYIGIFGYSDDEQLVIPTLWAKLGDVYLATDPSGDPSTDPTLPVWAQMQNAVLQLDSNKLDASKLPEAVNEALAQAKASGEFNGADGHTPVKGEDYFTEEDKAELVEDVLDALPNIEVSKVSSGDPVSFTPTLDTDIKVVSKINRDSSDITKRLNQIRLRHFTGSNVLDIAAELGLSDVGNSLTADGLTATSNGNGTVTITGTPTVSSGFIALVKKGFYQDVDSHQIYVLPAGTYTTHPNCRFNWKYVDNSNVGYGQKETYTFVKPFFITELSIQCRYDVSIPNDGLVVPLGIYKGSALPSSDFSFNGNTYVANFSSDVLTGEYNWDTGVLKDADGNVVETLQKIQLKSLDGKNTILTGVGENTVEYQSAGGSSDAIAGEVNGFNCAEYPLPILYLEGDIAAMSKDTKVTLNYKFNDRNGSCTCKWQGSSSLSYEKKNYTIEFDTPFEAYEGWGSQSKYCMKANYIDFSHIRNICAAKLWGEARKASNSDLFSSLINAGAIDGFPIAIVINGEYKGLYSFNIPKDGWMFGFTGNSNTEAIISAENGCDATMFKAPPVIDGNDFDFEYMDENADETALRASFTELYNQVTQYTGSDNMYTSALANVLDMDRLLDYYIFVVMLDAFDCFKKNYLMVTKDGVKWHLGAYDLDTIWGNHWQGSSYYKPTWRNFEWYASQSALFNIIYTHHRDELKSRFNLRKADKWSEANVFITLYNYAVQIPKIYFDEEVKIWKDLPGTYTNDIGEILNFHRMKINHLTNEVNGWQT